MKIDLHIHTKDGSDGNLYLNEIFEEAKRREIDVISITDHDSIDCQERAIKLAKENGMFYITGIELNVTFECPGIKPTSLDFLGYIYDIYDTSLRSALKEIREHRDKRAHKILEKLNDEFRKENITQFTEEDMENIRKSVDGVFGRPHIAKYLIKKGVVRDTQEAFNRYLVKCNVPKYPLTLSRASELIRHAGGWLVLAHPNDPNGTSLAGITYSLKEQTGIISEYMVDYVDGIECWHSRNDDITTKHYIDFCKNNNLKLTGGSDCHQNPIIMGSLDIPDCVAKQFR